MASRAQKRGEGVIGILKLLWTLGEQSKLFFKLFDCQIRPMPTYKLNDYVCCNVVCLFL